MDVIGQKDKAKAFNLMTDQLASGANEMYLFTMLVRQFRLLRQVKELLAQEKLASNFEIAKRIGCHPFVAQKIVNQVNYFTLEGLKKIFSQLLEIEHQMKTTGNSFRLMFDRFIVNL
jgi:DNA polymerase-3 subunit delta